MESSRYETDSTSQKVLELDKKMPVKSDGENAGRNVGENTLPPTVVIG